jgi:hypothetical protein
VLPRPAAALQRAQPLAHLAPRLHAARHGRRTAYSPQNWIQRDASFPCEASSNADQIFAAHWGNNELAPDVFIERVKQAGFDGIEMSLPLDVAERDEWTTRIAERAWA